eukprot:TRINITY_DN17283_c0_g2_i1.p2 TRINITY_DN17283_c0_g2~~TRINITY_DN17283_c0_g2_i1.p2  ORF type:complete len:380 (+),score=92.16 TRINITY_DN17283_c0_g2_i1:53-1141(+)
MASRQLLDAWRRFSSAFSQEVISKVPKKTWHNVGLGVVVCLAFAKTYSDRKEQTFYSVPSDVVSQFKLGDAKLKEFHAEVQKYSVESDEILDEAYSKLVEAVIAVQELHPDGEYPMEMLRIFSSFADACILKKEYQNAVNAASVCLKMIKKNADENRENNRQKLIQGEYLYGMGISICINQALGYLGLGMRDEALKAALNAKERTTSFVEFQMENFLAHSISGGLDAQLSLKLARIFLEVGKVEAAREVFQELFKYAEFRLGNSAFKDRALWRLEFARNCYPEDDERRAFLIRRSIQELIALHAYSDVPELFAELMDVQKKANSDPEVLERTLQELKQFSEVALDLQMQEAHKAAESLLNLS